MKKTLKKVLKISISVVLSVAIFFTIAITETVADSEVPAPKYTYEANIGKKWYFGNERITSFTSQGENGFYAMYSTAVNRGRDFPLETAKLCEYDSGDNYWKISDGSDGYLDYFKIASSQSGYGVSHAFTKAVHLATGYSAIIKWVAPKGGEYFV
ncbi:MAG: hypothetical protein GX957_02260, partial [Clostridiaceae bacterium]|nr:hypothetical protein [Clostridiaceae bacterium]